MDALLLSRSTITVYGHRGAREDDNGDTIVENTLDAFLAAQRGEGVGIEFDVWMTKDNVVVVHHDVTLARLSALGESDDRRVDETNYDDLPQLRDAATGKLYRIPTMKEVLDATETTTEIIVELKGKTFALVEAVHRLLTRAGRIGSCESRTIWFSLDAKVNAMLKHCDPTLQRVSSGQDVLLVVLAFYTGLLSFLDLKSRFDIFGLPLNCVDVNTFRTVFPAMPSAMCSVLAYIFGGDPPPLLARRELVNLLHQRGIPTIVLGADTHRSLSTCVHVNPDAIVSFRPAWVASALVS